MSATVRRAPVAVTFDYDPRLGIVWLGREGKEAEGYYLDRLADGTGVVLTNLVDRSRCYAVTIGAGALCTCPDAVYRRRACKHAIAVAALIEDGAL